MTGLKTGEFPQSTILVGIWKLEEHLIGRREAMGAALEQKWIKIRRIYYCTKYAE
jgi:hypothetical protein